MGREILANMMLVFISSIVIITIVLWEFEQHKHRKAVRSGLRNFWSREDATESGLSDDDPYDVGINDKDIL
jgi:hypothetical protein